MDDFILRGTGDAVTRMPRSELETILEGVPAEMARDLAFMQPGHHTVRSFVVQEIWRTGGHVNPERIVSATGIDASKLSPILDDLERNLFFLRRDAAGRVEWAYPVTAARTPHRLKFSTGEEVYAA